MNFRHLAGTSALLVAATNLGYSLSFLVVRPDNPDAGGTAASAFLLVGGLLALPVLLALYGLVKEGAPELALLATVLGVVGAVGAAVHGGYDLANAINPPGAVVDGPNAIDPRGLLTFGVGGLSLVVFAAALAPRRLAWLAAGLGVLLVALYVLRLVVLDADNAAIIGIAALVGFVLSPLWYVRVAAALAGPLPRRRATRAVAAM
jgi:hypothetical protein